MKKSLVRIVKPAVLLIFAIILAASASAAQTKNPQLVTDYFVIMPKEYLGMLEYTKKPRKSLISVRDDKNGFLELTTDEAEDTAQIALFRKTSREAVIAVASKSCGPACGGSLIFLQYANGKWRNITAQIMPEFSDKQILAAYNRIKARDDDAHTLSDMPYTFYELPQKGTIIELRNGDAGGSSDGKALLRFEWNGTRFNLAQAK